MANVSGISLKFKNGPTDDIKIVKVSGKVTFNREDINKTFRLEIKLFGDDGCSNNNVPKSDFINEDSCTFTFSLTPPFNWLKLPYKQFTVSEPGVQYFSEERNVNANAVDEEGGLEITGLASEATLLKLPKGDEVYATVALYEVPERFLARSEAVKFLDA